MGPVHDPIEPATPQVATRDATRSDVMHTRDGNGSVPGDEQEVWRSVAGREGHYEVSVGATSDVEARHVRATCQRRAGTCAG